MKSKIINHHYTECGLPNVWIKCRCVKDNAGKDTIIIPNIGLLHKAIARDIILSDGALSGDEIKYLRSMMELTPAEFGVLLYRTGQTVARWEKGESAPEAVTDAFIRLLAAGKVLESAVDAAEISGKWRVVERKKPIRISEVQAGRSRVDAFSMAA